MSSRPIKNAFLVGLSAAMLFCSVQAQSCSILHVYGSNGINGAGFAVDNSGRIPRNIKNGGDPGADSTVFNGGPNPNPICGRVPKLQASVNVPEYVAKAISAGVPKVYQNGSVPMDIFQINRQGGGPAKCQVSTDLTGKTFSDMDVTLNMPGNFGIYNADYRTIRVVATFKEGTKCTGGATKDLCLVRCMAGQGPSNKEQYTCGGCFVVQLDGTVSRTKSTSSVASSGYSLTSQQMSSLISQSITLAKQAKLVSRSTPESGGHHQ